VSLELDPALPLEPEAMNGMKPALLSSLLRCDAEDGQRPCGPQEFTSRTKGAYQVEAAAVSDVLPPAAAACRDIPLPNVIYVVLCFGADFVPTGSP